MGRKAISKGEARSRISLLGITQYNRDRSALRNNAGIGIGQSVPMFCSLAAISAKD